MKSYATQKPFHDFPRVVMVALSLALLPLSGCAQTPPPGTGRVVDKDGKPVAGVHVLSWRASSTVPWFPFARSTGSCEAEHYSVTGNDGAFIVPSDVIKRPRSVSQSGMATIVYKPGMVGEFTKFSVEPSWIPWDPNGKDVFPTKDNPLVVEIVVKEDGRPNDERIRALYSIDNSAGCSCSGFVKAVEDELVQNFIDTKRKNPKLNYATPLYKCR